MDTLEQKENMSALPVRGCGSVACQRGSSFSLMPLRGVFRRISPEMCVMRPTFTAAMCATFVGLLALAQSATAEPKTASQCNADWAANKASIQASGKTKRAFVAECRGVPIAARQPTALDKASTRPKPRRKQTVRMMRSCGSIPYP